MGKYQLYCPYCKQYLEEYYTLDCLNHSVLIRTAFNEKKFNVQNLNGIWKFIDWLPVQTPLKIDSSGPTTYKSVELARELGLESLYISYNGYWPEKGANVKTCTFKEYEALITFPRVIENGYKGIYLASAGNTARAFAYISQLIQVPVVLFVPKENFETFWVPATNGESIRLITLREGNDYTEACRLNTRVMGQLSSDTSFVPEGGAKNVARRDGMATVLYDCVRILKKMPKHYFQAIGSGTGGISVWEAALRLRADGRFGTYLPQLHLSQNLPYAPIVNAWALKSRELVPNRDMPDALNNIKEVKAKMLTNRAPPYSIPGGVFDALTDTKGRMYGITNDELDIAEKIFYETEGIDIVYEAAVALASLQKAVDAKIIDIKDPILLNITGGGIERLKEDQELYSISPILTVDNADVPLDKIKEILI